MTYISLVDFQIDAKKRLLDAVDADKKKIYLQSCTGSGKTIILTHFIDDYLQQHDKTVFIWLTPGNGELEEQSKGKMDKYIHGRSTKLLSDVLLAGFEENDVCFINWQLVTMKTNLSIREGEKLNFYDLIDKAHNEKLSFVIIVDEAHHNSTLKSELILECFKPKSIIKCSATPNNAQDDLLIKIDDEAVKASGLIKKEILINSDFADSFTITNEIAYLLQMALDKQIELRSKFLQIGRDVNPLILIQVPSNKSEKQSNPVLDSVEEYLVNKNISCENGLLAFWLDKRKENIENITENNAKPIAVVMKQALSLGWDCPRAYILVKLRQNMDEKFEVQTIGRIRRMPEHQHYNDEILDNCYIFTFDSKFIIAAQEKYGWIPWASMTLHLKPEYTGFVLPKENKTYSFVSTDPVNTFHVLSQYLQKKYALDINTDKNASLLKKAGYSISNFKESTTIKGVIADINISEIANLKTLTVKDDLGTHELGRFFHHYLDIIGNSVGLEYHDFNLIFRRLFDAEEQSDIKLLSLSKRELYVFAINNHEQLVEDFREAIKTPGDTIEHPKDVDVSISDFKFPEYSIFTFDSHDKSAKECPKNIYVGYLSSAQKRWESEVAFEKYCEFKNSISWFYKNGDSGQKYFSIMYMDNAGKKLLFYPDYIVGDTNGTVWIIEAKGPFTKDGGGDIDDATELKFEALKRYIAERNGKCGYKLKGGIVRLLGDRLLFCDEKYERNNSRSEYWKPLSNIL